MMITYNFITAGKATFTFSNPKKERYTFRVVYSESIKKYFAYLLTGSNNDNDYTYVGMLSNDLFIHTAKSKYSNGSKVMRVLNYALRIAAGKKPLPEGYFLEHNGHCAKCGRQLTTPESIKLGIGPTCLSKLN